MKLSKLNIFLVCCLVVFLTAVFVFLLIQGDEAPAQSLSNNQVDAQDVVYEKIEGYYSAPIFSFHHISSAPAGVSKNIASLYVEPYQLEKILVDLNTHNYKTVFVSEIAELLVRGDMPPENWVAITFDDGNIDFYNNALPLLKKYNIKATLYIMTGIRGVNYVNEEQIKEIDESGLVEIGSHTVYHPNLVKISETRVREELSVSKDYLEKLLDKEVSGICYPFGDYNERVKNLAREAGYKYGVSYNHRPQNDITDLFEMNRAGVWPGMSIVKFLEK